MNTLMMLFALAAADKLTLSGDYEQSERILNSIKSNSVEYSYLRAVNNFALNQKTETEKWIAKGLDSFDKLPRRKELLIERMEWELESWKSGDLLDIERDMKISRNKLENGRGGGKTQEIQQQIVDKLNKLIKQEEDKQNKNNSANNSPNPAKVEQPAEDSNIMGGKGKGEVTEKDLRKLGESWGTLPPEQRAKVIRDLEFDLPPKYKAQIEAYLENIRRMRK